MHLKYHICLKFPTVVGNLIIDLGIAALFIWKIVSLNMQQCYLECTLMGKYRIRSNF